MQNNKDYLIFKPFMSQELNLSGVELLVYMLIYSFSRDKAGLFVGTINYITKTFNISETSAKNALKSLLDKGFIEFVELQEKTNKKNIKAYRATYKEKTSKKADVSFNVESQNKAVVENVVKNAKIDYKKDLREYAKNLYETNKQDIQLTLSQWLEWVDYKLQKERKITHFTFNKNFKELCSFGGLAYNAIEKSISCNWSGLFLGSDSRKKDNSIYNEMFPSESDINEGAGKVIDLATGREVEI